MKRIIIISLIAASFMVIHLSMVNPGEGVDVPVKKMEKAIRKVWKISDFQLVKESDGDGRYCSEMGCWFRVTASGEDLGRIYVGRVNSCRSGGCTVNMKEEEVAFEFFDYFLLTDMSGEVKWVKVFNYQATQGHEVMSRGWLNQFRGLTSEIHPVFGEDNEALSGATVSAKAITQDIQDVLQCLAVN
ncbi:MAG: FMN-binding protein [bacterium]